MFIQEKRKAKEEMIFMKEVDSKTEIGKILETGLKDQNTEVNPSLDKTSGEKISEEGTEKILGTAIDLTNIKNRPSAFRKFWEEWQK